MFKNLLRWWQDYQLQVTRFETRHEDGCNGQEVRKVCKYCGSQQVVSYVPGYCVFAPYWIFTLNPCRFCLVEVVRVHERQEVEGM